MNFRFFGFVRRRGPVGHVFFVVVALSGVVVFEFSLLGLSRQPCPGPEVSLVTRPCQRTGCPIITRPGHLGTDARATKLGKYLDFWAASEPGGPSKLSWTDPSGQATGAGSLV